jgi:arylsulfatase A-like enzyme/Flp pilus assembly protein TadD
VFRFALFPLAALVGQVCCAAASTPVILISVDTLRADHLSCYQANRRPTPHIDELARKGTLFSQVNTPFPLTLPAHTALLTSLYPFTTGVEDNGVPLGSNPATLATILKSGGYRTAAFVSSFVLDRRFGLNRGFDVYEGPVEPHDPAPGAPVEHKLAGAQVAGAAEHWLERNSSGPYFLFLHLYDLHLPYDVPQEPSQRHGEAGYTAEVGYEDRVLGDFWAFLEKRGLLDKALIVFTSDHGEGLGDHGESSHGYFVYQSTLHVPLLIRWPAGFTRTPGSRVDEPASLLDVAPTILDAVGIAHPAEMRGHSLIGARGPEDVYSESLYARNHFGCAALRTLRQGYYLYIEAPKPELYDLASDPNEQHNLFEQDRARATSMNEKMVAIRGSATPAHASSTKPDTMSALRSLGYLTGSTAKGPEPHVDPKDRSVDFERFLTALSLASADKLAESDTILRGLRDKLPDIVDIHLNLGWNQQRLGDFSKAAAEFKQATELAPSDGEAHFELGFCDFRLGQMDAAEKQLKAALALEPWYSRADEALAEIDLQKKDFNQARAHLEHLLAVDPHSYAGHYNLGVMAAMAQNWSEAQQQVQAAIEADPGSAEAHNTLGMIDLQRGELEPARHEFEETVRLQPRLATAHYNLGMVLQKEGKADAAAQEFRAAQEAGGRKQ